MKTFVNLTPHAIKLPNMTVEPSGKVARLDEKTKILGEIDGVEFLLREYTGTIDLPNVAPRTIYIVSGMVREANPDRLDIASPGDLLRDESGQIIGCKNLILNPA